MMLSLTCQTAIRAVVYLASKFESGEKVGIKEIAEFINASEHSVGKLLQTLVKENIINSAKGPTGGFYISEKQFIQPMIKIVNAIDGDDVFDQCGLGFKKCSSQHPCPMHKDYKIIRDQFETMCQKRKVKDWCASVNEGEAFLMG